MRDGLDRFQVLVVADGDVLTASVAAKILAFQKRGGIVVADTRLCPAITADIVLTPRERSKDAKEAKTALLEVAQELRGRLDAKYRRAVESSDADVITALRRSDKTDYVFAINDKREFGKYVGSHKLVMEAGLPARTVVRLARARKGPCTTRWVERGCSPRNGTGGWTCRWNCHPARGVCSW